jgi:nucleoside-diphosphate-sugar epimerase
MNLLLTGSLGHIGTFFLKKIARDNIINKIFIIDNNRSERINTLFNYKNKNKVFFRLGDLTKKDTFKYIKNINTVIHFASITNAEESINIKKELIHNNFSSFINVVNYCVYNNCNLIHISSTSVYGSQEIKVDENCKSLKPQSPYAEVKLKEEQYLQRVKNKLNFVTLRFGTIAGTSDGMRFHTAVNKFCFNAIMNKPITVWQTAMNQYRPYLSIRDAYKTIIFIIKKRIFDKQVYNVVSSNLTVKQILEIIKKYKKKITIKFTHSKIMNQLSYHVSTKKINTKGLTLNSKIETDIKNTFKLFKNIKII